MKFSNIVVVIIGICSFFTYASEKELALAHVKCGWARHLGTRTYQEDRANFGSIGDHYHWSIVCDGHGGEDVSSYVSREFSGILQQCLEDQTTILKSKVSQIIVTAFEQCEANILHQQNSAEKQPGTTVIFSLWDLKNKKKYIANLGDSRLYAFSKTGELLFHTQDHKVTDGLEKDYVESHGGVIIQNGYQKGVAIAEKVKEMGALETPRALGDAHLKTIIGFDNKYGPVNATPTIYEEDITEDHVELLVTDGYTKLMDEVCSDITTQELWKDACGDTEMSDEEFYNKYNWGGLSLTVDKQEDLHGDVRCSSAAKRMIYALRYMNETEASMDNVTILMRYLACDQKINSEGAAQVGNEVSIKDQAKRTGKTLLTVSTISFYLIAMLYMVYNKYYAQ